MQKLKIVALSLIISLNLYGKEKNPLCPIEIIGNQAIGPFSFTMTEQGLEKQFPSGKWSKYPGSIESGETSFLEVDELKVSFCNGVVDDIWIDDLNKAPKCLRYNNKSLPNKLAVKSAKKLFAGCPDPILRIGGTFYKCKAGVMIGIGSGGNQEYVDQIRLAAALDKKCPSRLTGK